jgi:hypothetical protein
MSKKSFNKLSMKPQSRTCNQASKGFILKMSQLAAAQENE